MANDTTTGLSKNPLWQQMHGRIWRCPCCEMEFDGIPDISYMAPHDWREDAEPVPNKDSLNLDHFLAEDVCMIDGEFFYIRSVLQLPIIGSDGVSFGFGVWAQVSGEDFRHYCSVFDDDQFDEDQDPWFCVISNELPGYPDSLDLTGRLYGQQNRQRPLVRVDPTANPLRHDQQHGLTFDKLLDIFAARGHDFRAALGK